MTGLTPNGFSLDFQFFFADENSSKKATGNLAKTNRERTNGVFADENSAKKQLGSQ